MSAFRDFVDYVKGASAALPGGSNEAGGGGSDDATGDSTGSSGNPTLSDAAAGLAGAVYHAAGVYYHGAQADLSLLTGDDAGVKQHVSEAQQSLAEGTASVKPTVQYVEGLVGYPPTRDLGDVDAPGASGGGGGGTADGGAPAGDGGGGG